MLMSNKKENMCRNFAYVLRTSTEQYVYAAVYPVPTSAAPRFRPPFLTRFTLDQR